MRIKVALPDLQPRWVGGIHYLSTLRLGIQILETRGVIKIVNRPRLLIDDLKLRRKYGVINAATYAVDALRGIGALNIPRRLGPFSKRSLTWIPDLQDLERPDFFEKAEIVRREKRRKKSCARGDVFFFSSNHARGVFETIGYENALIAGVLRFATKMDVEQNQPPFYIDCAGCKHNGFFYLPNQWWVHKNHKWALESFKEYQSNGGSAHLVLTGLESDSRWPDYSADQIFSNMSLKNVHRLGLVDRSFQLQLYAMAIAVIQPSRYEGWSTTIEEALSFGTPIIASDIPANREQLLDCTDAKFVSSDSELSLVEALHSPPDKQSKLQSESRNSFRWNRFLADLETILIRGDDLTRVD